MSIRFVSNKDIGDSVKASMNKAKSEICLTSPWVIGERLQGLFSKETKARIISGKVSLRIVIRLRDVSDMDITNAPTFNFLREVGADLRFSSQLHAKLVVIDSKEAFASSSNITGAGYRDELQGGNEEAGFYTDDPDEVLSAQARFEEICSVQRPSSGLLSLSYVPSKPAPLCRSIVRMAI